MGGTSQVGRATDLQVVGWLPIKAAAFRQIVHTYSHTLLYNINTYSHTLIHNISIYIYTLIRNIDTHSYTHIHNINTHSYTLIHNINVYKLLRRSQGLRGRTSESRLGEPVFKSCAAVLKPLASFFHSTLLQYTQPYK